MDEKKFLNLNGLSSFLTNLKKIFATAAQGTKADSAYTHAQSAHAPSNAERNIVVGIQKNGSDLTPNSSSRKVNITVPTKVSELTNDSGYKTTDTTYENATTSTDGLMAAADKTKLDGIAAGANKYTLPTASSSTLGGVKTTSAVTSTSGLTPCPIISGVPYYKDTNTTYSLSSFGITATAAELNKLDGCTATVGELNYVHGVTSAIQTQLNAKAASNHTHSGYAASSHNHSATNITSGTLPVARGGTGGTTAATARTGIGAINTVCQTTEPTTQNTGDFWFREV